MNSRSDTDPALRARVKTIDCAIEECGWRGVEHYHALAAAEAAPLDVEVRRYVVARTRHGSGTGTLADVEAAYSAMMSALAATSREGEG